MDTKTNLIKYCNAGHNPPFLLSNGRDIQKLDIGGVVVGIMPNYPFQKGECSLKVNDVLVLYSDGVTEAMNVLQEEFGEEKMLDIVRANLKCTSEEIVQKILAAVKNHSNKIEQSDDITIMVIKRIE